MAKSKDKASSGNYIMPSGLVHRSQSLADEPLAPYPNIQKAGTPAGAKSQNSGEAPNLFKKFLSGDGGKD